MGKTMFLKVICICLLIIISFSGVCLASESTVTVSYTPTYEELATFQTKVIVSADIKDFGAVYEGDNKLKVGETIYELRIKERKEFRIVPSVGNDVEKVLYDGEDILNKLQQAKRSIQKEYLIEIEGKGYETKLEIIFEKVPTGEMNPPNKPIQPDESGSNKPFIDNSNTSQTPNTGDTTNVNEFIVLAGIAGIVITTLLMFKKRRGKIK